MLLDLDVLRKDQRTMQRRLARQTDTLKAVSADVDRHRAENDAVLGELKKHGDNFEDFDSSSYEEAEATENAYLKRVVQVETEIQRASERKLVSMGYSVLGGSPPIRVEIKLNRSVSSGRDGGDTLIMQLGPTSLIPHSIELFLMLVQEKRFFDGLTLMFRNVGHPMIYTVPMQLSKMQEVSATHSVLGSIKEAKESAELRREDDLLLNRLALIEQTEDFPVEKYSGTVLNAWFLCFSFGSTSTIFSN
jgi:hypothetical protein